MTRILTIIILLLTIQSIGQTAKIDTLFFQVDENSEYSNAQKLKFPIIRTGNKKADLLITADLRDKVTNNEYPNLKTDSALIKWGKGIMTELNFEVTYNQKGILSLNIYFEGCGAHCSDYTYYFNYSLITGSSLSLNDIVDTTDSFRNIVYTDLHRQYETQKNELKKLLTNAPDETSYTWALGNYKSCEEDFHLTTFALYPDSLEIIEHCYLPHAIQNLAPVIELKYKYADIKEYLKIN